MAPLRFRCWHEGKMHYQVGIHPDHGTPCVPGNSNTDDWLVYLHGGTVMQSTGLTDKNGKEIFESDVLKFPATWNEGKPDWIVNGVVTCEEYDDGEKYGDHRHFGWIVKYRINDYESRTTLPDVREYCEIVADMHSNPDLLPSSRRK